MIKFRKDVVDQELEEGEISGQIEEPQKSPSRPVILSKPKTEQVSGQQSDSQEYLYQTIKIDEKSSSSARKKQRKDYKVDEKLPISKQQPKNSSNSDSPQQIKLTPVLHPPQINSFYPNSQPPNPYIFQQPEYQNMRMYQPNQGYHPFTQFPPQQNMPSQFIPQQPMKVYPNQWNQARKNQQMRMPSYLNENPQFPTYHQNPQFVQQNPQMMQVQQQQQNQFKIQQQQKQNQRRMKEKEEAKKQARKEAKKQERKKRIQNIKVTVKEKLKELDEEVDEEEKIQITSLIKQSIEIEKPSELIIDLLENKTLQNKKVKQIVEEILTLTQATKILQKLKERNLLRRIVGQRKIQQAEELFEKVRKDPRLKNV